MKGIEKIYYKDRVAAIVFRRNIPVQGLKFFTGDLNPFQVGIHSRKKGTKLSPHIHEIVKPLTIKTIQEILFVQDGRIRLTLYNKNGEVIDKKILKPGDSVLLIAEGHGVDFLEDARIFEVKQGPYPGTKHAKIYFGKRL